MQTIRGIENLKKKYKNTALTIGNFDGVHIGHVKIFREVLEEARRTGGTAMAVTFDPHPAKVISPERGMRILTPTEEKARLIGVHGIEVLLLINFDREFSNLHPEVFIKDFLADKLAVKKVIVGHNYCFGRARKGTTALLRKRGKKYGFGLRVVRNARLHGDVVSSSRVRGLLLRGRVCEASMFLGRPYMMEGTVIKGRGRGKVFLGIPTANITTPSELIPKEGVYAVKVMVGGNEYGGAANIGYNPTFKDGLKSYEVHILDFSGDILGKNLRMHFIDRIRDEKAFPDMKSLEAGIRRDIERAREILKRKKHPPIV